MLKPMTHKTIVKVDCDQARSHDEAEYAKTRLDDSPADPIRKQGA